MFAFNILAAAQGLLVSTGDPGCSACSCKAQVGAHPTVVTVAWLSLAMSTAWAVRPLSTFVS